jgi:hypothetical protein
MEDASCRMEGLEVAGCSLDPLAFYCIFDGHGGRAAADFVSQNLVRNITDDPVFAKDPERAMVRARAPDPPPALILFPLRISSTLIPATSNPPLDPADD